MKNPLMRWLLSMDEKWRFLMDAEWRISPDANTGLDCLENTTTKQRVESLIKLDKEGIDTLALVHPYIHKVSDLSFFDTLKESNINYISWKGFRYNPNNMLELKKYIPNEILSQYKCNEEEVLLGENFIKKMANQSNLQYVDLKKYIQKPNSIPGVSLEKAKQQVMELFEISVPSTSEKNIDDLLNYCIERRL